MPRVRLAPLLLAAAAAAQQPGDSSPRDLWTLLPAETIAVVDLQDGPETLRRFHAAVGPLPKEFAGAAGLARIAGDLALRARLGVGLEDLVSTVAPRQVLVALLPGEPAPFPILLSRVEDPDAAAALLERLRRGPDVTLAAELRDRCLVVAANEAQLGAFSARRPAPAQSLLARDSMQRAPLETGAGLRLFVDLTALRARAGGRKLWDQLDAAGRLLLGPVARRIDAAGRLDATLRFLPDGIELAATLEGAPPADDPSRHLVAHGDAARRSIDPPRGTLLAISLDRSLRGLYRHADDLLRDDDAAQAKAGLSILDAITGGSFVDGVLGGLAEPFDLYVLPRAEALETVPDAPGLRLPSFALVTAVDDPKSARALERSLAILSLIQAQERRQRGLEPFLLRRDAVGPGLDAQTFEPPDWEGPGRMPAEYGLAPTLLVTGGHLIAASTRDGAAAIAGALGGRRQLRGDWWYADGIAIADYLRRNLDLFAVDRVLQQGHDIEAARRFFAHLAIALERVGTAELHWLPEPGRTRIELVTRRLP